ncbi:MAG: glycosyltransferase [Bacteroidota bacterium]
MPNRPSLDLSASAEATSARPYRASVVVPTLNEEKTLEALLRPLREHAEVLGLELVVSDGGSTDSTLAIALALADRVVVHDGPSRQTIAAGRNAGAAQAASPSVLLFFNADVTLPDRLGAFVDDLIHAATEEGAATCRVLVDPRYATWMERVVLETANGIYWLTNRLRIVGMGRGEVHAVRRDLFVAAGGYRDHLAAGEDFDLFKRLLRRPGARIAFLWQWTVHEDPRRYRQRGLLRTMLDWSLNAVWVAARDESRSTEWEAVR